MKKAVNQELNGYNPFESSAGTLVSPLCFLEFRYANRFATQFVGGCFRVLSCSYAVVCSCLSFGGAVVDCW